MARLHSLFIWENDLYFVITEVDETDALLIRTMCCDLENGNLAEIIVTNPERKEVYSESTPTAEREIDGKIYFLDRSEKEQYLLVADSKGGEAEQVIKYVSPSGISVMDDQYIYMITSENGKFLSIDTLDGELVNKIDLEENEDDFLMVTCMAGGSETAAFVYMEMFSETEDVFTKIWKLDKTMIGTNDCSLELLVDTKGQTIIYR